MITYKLSLEKFGLIVNLLWPKMKPKSKPNLKTKNSQKSSKILRLKLKFNRYFEKVKTTYNLLIAPTESPRTKMKRIWMI